ncbi:Puratrophin-1 [Toxocara canis]|uniref:Puratrophin-1 n=1 Tax=Toxocara canis TaxID=6265 RepID=A0A0B2V8P1_TOXCA|nr:Puratrophin-1 [Toxocara canis]
MRLESSEMESRLKGMEKMKDLKTFNVNRLSAQVKRAEELSLCENSKMNEVSERLSEVDRLLEECCWFDDTDRGAVEGAVARMREKIVSGRQRVELVVDVLKKALEARKLIDQLYDWALLHAKKQCEESAQATLIKLFPSAAVSRLRQYIDVCSDPPVRHEIETLVHDCENAMRGLTVTGDAKTTKKTELKCADQEPAEVHDGGATDSAQEESPSLELVHSPEPEQNYELRASESIDSEVTLVAGASESTLIAEAEFDSTNDLENSSAQMDHLSESMLEKSGKMPQPHEHLIVGVCYEDGAKSNTRTKKISNELEDDVKEAKVATGDSEVIREMAASDSCLGAEMDSSVPGSSLAKSRSDLSDSISDTPMEIFSDIEETLMASCSRVVNADVLPPPRHRSVSPAPTQYEIPISKASTSQVEPVKKEMCELDEIIRWRRNSWCSTINTDDSCQLEEHAIGAAPVTLNLTDKVITTMSSNTLHKRLDQRRSVSSVALRLPNPFLINGAVRPGSARFVSAKSRPMLSRNSTIDLFDQESVLNAFQFLDDDYSVSGENVGNVPSAALSTLDFSMRSEQIDVIREWLNPAKTSDPNNRIECTVVRDLLDSEIEYVRTLRLIVQDFVPELARVDIPAALRGKKFRMFGNIERLFQFHAHSFLPQLISRLRFRPADEPLSLTVGRLFVDHASLFNLYSLYAKNKPKSDELMRECGNDFFHSIQGGMELAPLLVRPIERISKYTLALQQLHNAAPPNKLEVVLVLERAVSTVSRQIRHGSDLLAMEHITGCDLNLREQGALMRNDTMLVTEKKGIHTKKRLRSVFLFENCVVLTKPKLCRASKRSGIYDELRYKGSIQMTDCGLTEMVKDSKVKFELWFRKQTNSFTYVLEAQSPSVRDAWVADIRNILWKQAIRSREESLREKANMGMEPCASYIHLAINSPSEEAERQLQMGIGSLRERTTSEIARRPRSLISLTASSCSSSNNTRIPNIGCTGCEIGDLCRVEESDETDALIDESLLGVHMQDSTCSLPRFRAPPPPSTTYPTSQ